MMKKADYLDKLNELLSDISADERNDALDYYNDYLDGDSPEDIEKRMAELGTPEELAEKIKLASGDTHIVEGEFTETGYSDSADEAIDAPDKFTQLAETANDTTGNTGEKKYNIFGVTITKSVLILLIILLLLIIPIFGRLGGRLIRAVTSIPRAITHIGDVGDITEDIGDIAGDVADSIAAASGDKAASSSNVTTDGNKVVIGEGAEVKDMEIDAGAIAFYVKKSSDNTISAECDNDVKFKTSLESGTLKIEVARENKHALDSDKKAVLYLPTDMSVSDVSIEAGAAHLVWETDFNCKDLNINLGAGDLKMGKVTAKSADLDIGAGELRFDDLVVEDADIDVEMGNFTMKGDITGKLDLDVAMGNATFNITSSEKDHNYDYEVGMGSLNIGKTKVSGMSTNRKIDNNASSDYDINVGMGNAEFKF